MCSFPLHMREAGVFLSSIDWFSNSSILLINASDRERYIITLLFVDATAAAHNE